MDRHLDHRGFLPMVFDEKGTGPKPVVSPVSNNKNVSKKGAGRAVWPDLSGRNVTECCPHCEMKWFGCARALSYIASKQRTGATHGLRLDQYTDA